MIRLEEICKTLQDIFKCDSVSYYEDNYNMHNTIFELKKDGKNYNVLINDEIIKEIPLRKVISYISKYYIDLILNKEK